MACAAWSCDGSLGRPEGAPAFGLAPPGAGLPPGAGPALGAAPAAGLLPPLEAPPGAPCSGAPVGAPRPPPADCVRELARQARLQWATQAHARGLEHHYGQLQERILSAEAAVERQAAEIEELRRRCAELSGRLAEP